MLIIVTVWPRSRRKHHNKNVWRRNKMKSFRRIIFISFLVILLSISFGSSLALTDTTTATFIWSIDSRYKYQPDSDRRLSTSFSLRVYDNEGATELSTKPQSFSIKLYDGSTVVNSSNRGTNTYWNSSVSFGGIQGTLSAAKWYRFSYVNNTMTAYISGTARFTGAAHQ